MTQAEFKSLFDLYFDPLRRYVYYRSGDLDLASDVAQEAFVKLWERGYSKPEKELLRLLYKMAGDLFISKYRHSKVVQNYAMKMPDENNSESPEDVLRFKELKKQYERALTLMPEKQRVVFLMSRMEELKYQEIAERLKLSVKAVEKRMKNALQFLREALEN